MKTSNIVLVGFMGTGKSATAWLVARRLERQLVDMDAEIEKRAGKRIPAIFAQDGEPHFRKLERELVQDISQRRNLVIAAGGGVVLDPDNVEDLSRNGVLVCLSSEAETILRRVGAERHRPLLEGDDKVRKILDLLEKRRPYYNAIPNQLDTTHITPEVTAERVLEIFDRVAKD